MALELTREQLLEEREYLLTRAAQAGNATFEYGRWTGISSNALITYVFGGPEPAERDFPRDPSDLASCYRAVRRLPDHLRPRGEAILPRYREFVASRYDLKELDLLMEAELRAGRLS